jgi:hypothetical protein
MRRASPTIDSPLTTRACADYLGFTAEWIRGAITDGVLVKGRLVTLDAETVDVGARHVYRVHPDQFRAFLQAIGWKRLPAVRVGRVA